MVIGYLMWLVSFVSTSATTYLLQQRGGAGPPRGVSRPCALPPEREPGAARLSRARTLILYSFHNWDHRSLVVLTVTGLIALERRRPVMGSFLLSLGAWARSSTPACSCRSSQCNVVGEGVDQTGPARSSPRRRSPPPCSNAPILLDVSRWPGGGRSTSRRAAKGLPPGRSGHSLGNLRWCSTCTASTSAEWANRTSMLAMAVGLSLVGWLLHPATGSPRWRAP